MVSEQLRAEIKERHADGESSATIADDYGLPVGVVSGITQGAKKAADKTKAADVKNAELSDIITSFRSNGCSIPRCPKCKAIMTDVKQKSSDGTFHFNCGKCDYTDWGDKLCKNECCRTGLKMLLEQEGVEYTDTETEEGGDEYKCPYCQGDLFDLGNGKYQCSECGKLCEDT